MLFAYLDAGSGSLVLQMIVGGLAGLVTMIRFRLSRRSDAQDNVAVEKADEDITNT